MSDTNDKAISVLNELIETCKDGAKGFESASEKAESPELKSLFHEYATQRTSFAADLDGHVVSLRGKPAESGHVAAAAHRGWIDIKTALSGNDDKALLNECERGEDYAKKAYTDALKEDLPADARAIVQRQATEVKAAHDRVRDLRNAANAAAGADGATTIPTETEPVYRN
ncbi:MAG: PA2169 family four-helix-bundle protein [Phycisphaerae bacterium]|nr:PA2169 family four-helix-bundle protein [Gemmatimonadaceae bacterium]